MTEALKRRLKQTQFPSAAEEALLAVMVAAATLNERMERVCAKHKITRSQYNVLRILRGVYPKGHPRGDIGCRMVDRAPDITRLLDRLETRKLVRRARGSEDQRQTVTFITAKGLRLLNAMQPKTDAEIANVLRGMSEQECRELSRLCGLILEAEEATGD